jgi:hypothetical protein
MRGWNGLLPANRSSALGKQEESKNAEILEENHGGESTVLTGHLPGEWS